MPTKMVTVRSLSTAVDAANSGRHPLNRPTNECSNFDWSLHVSVTGLRLLGIPLDSSGIQSPLFRYWSIIIGWIVLIGNLGGNLAIITDLVGRQLVSKSTTTTDWNLLINQLNFAFFFVTNHAGFFFCTASNWREMRRILGRIENLCLFNAEDHRKFRRIFTIGNFAVLVMVYSIF